MSSTRQIYTSYFAQSVNLTRAGIVPISIALNPPRGCHFLEYKKLAPTFDILFRYKCDQDEARYTERYKTEVLAKLDPHDVMQDLIHLAGKNQMFALICFERSDAFCHRHIVAEWLTEHGYSCKEFPSGTFGHRARVSLAEEFQ